MQRSVINSIVHILARKALLKIAAKNTRWIWPTEGIELFFGPRVVFSTLG